MKKVFFKGFVSFSVVCFGLLLGTVQVLKAQQKVFTMEEAILANGGKLNPENLLGLEWRDSERMTWLEKEKIVQKNVVSGKVDTLISTAEIKKIILEKGIDKEIKGYNNFGWVDGFSIAVKNNETSYFINLDSKKIKTFKTFEKDAEEINFNHHKNSQNYHWTYNKGNGLFNEHGEILDKDTILGIVYGKSVHRNEWGIKGGIFWSNSKESVAFYKMDERMVTDYPLFHITERPGKNEIIKYPMAGMKSHQVKLGVYHYARKKTIYLETGVPLEKYLTNITWSLDDKFICIQELNRGQDTINLVIYDAENGKKIKVLYTETSPKYVEPLFPIYFINKEQYLIVSATSGYRHFYLGDINYPQLLKQITDGDWQIVDVLKQSEDKKQIYFSSTQVSPIDVNIYSLTVPKPQYLNVNLKQTIPLQLNLISSGKGTHTAIFSQTGKYYVDKYSSTEIPRIIEVRNIKSGKVINTLLKSKNPLLDYKLGNLTMGKLKTSDGKTDLYYRMFTPPNYDPNKKYPAVVYLYGGPHAQMITNSWQGGANLWFQYMAQQGYVMFTIDNRGSMNRGQEFEQITHKQLGTVEMEDQMAGLKYLKSFPFVDSTKVGVHGWSFGGFMTTSLMTRMPWAFKVGVCGGPVIDWSFYEIMYTERYMGSPIINKEGYKKNELTQYVPNLKGKLLMIHGVVDDVVVMQHSLKYVRETVKKGIQMDYFVYPEHPHNVLGKDRVHLMQKVTDYFNLHLK